MKYVVVVLLWISSIASMYYYGYQAGIDSEINRQVEIRQAIEETRKLAMEGAASEIANIKIQSTTIQGKVTTLIRDNPVYVDCKHTPDGLRLINQALTGE